MKSTIKKAGIILAGFLIATVMTCTSVFAKGEVTYDGDAKEFIFEPGSNYSPTDLFENYKGVMPGDSLTDTIIVTNKNITDKKVKIYIRSLGAQLDTDDFLSKLTLTVKQNGDTVLFEASPTEKAQLTDWVLLGTLSPGGSTELLITLNVPIDLDSKYMDTYGYLDWEFMVEEMPDETPSPTKTPSVTPTATVSPGGGSGVNTGDNTSFGFYYVCIAGALSVGIASLLFGRKLKKRD